METFIGQFSGEEIFITRNNDATCMGCGFLSCNEENCCLENNFKHKTESCKPIPIVPGSYMDCLICYDTSYLDYVSDKRKEFIIDKTEFLWNKIRIILLDNKHLNTYKVITPCIQMFVKAFKSYFNLKKEYEKEKEEEEEEYISDSESESEEEDFEFTADILKEQLYKKIIIPKSLRYECLVKYIYEIKNYIRNNVIEYEQASLDRIKQLEEEEYLNISYS